MKKIYWSIANIAMTVICTIVVEIQRVSIDTIGIWGIPFDTSNYGVFVYG